MSTQNIIELAKQAGFRERNGIVRTMHSSGAWVGINEELKAFAALVRAQVLEEAALVCDEQAHDWHLHAKGGPVAAYNACAAAIRALKEMT